MPDNRTTTADRDFAERERQRQLEYEAREIESGRQRYTTRNTSPYGELRREIRKVTRERQKRNGGLYRR